jgi:hypothetical protein
MKRFLIIILLLAFVGMIYGKAHVAATTCRGCGALTMGNPSKKIHRPGCPYAPKTGSNANIGGDQSLLGSLLKSIFEPEPAASPQDGIDQQNAIRQQLAQEREKQIQLKQQKERELAQQKIFEEEKGKLIGALKRTDSGMLGIEGSNPPTTELKLKTIGTDFFGIDNAANAKPLLEGTSNDPLLELSEELMEIQGELIQQRLEEPNKWCSAIYKSLKTNAPPPPHKKFDELLPGDVLLLEGKVIAFVDNQFSSGDRASNASHTVIFLKEVNGKKYFLDNQPALVNWGKGGSRIIDEDECKKIYGQRGTEVARLVGQPLNPEEAKLLFAAAVEKARKNRQAIAKNWFGSPWLGTNFGAWGKDDVVCSEVDWALINATGRSIPESVNWAKAKLIKFSPADYVNSQFFVVTRLD